MAPHLLAVLSCGWCTPWIQAGELTTESSSNQPATVAARAAGQWSQRSQPRQVVARRTDHEAARSDFSRLRWRSARQAAPSPVAAMPTTNASSPRVRQPLTRIDVWNPSGEPVIAATGSQPLGPLADPFANPLEQIAQNEETLDDLLLELEDNDSDATDELDLLEQELTDESDPSKVEDTASDPLDDFDMLLNEDERQKNALLEVPNDFPEPKDDISSIDEQDDDLQFDKNLENDHEDDVDSNFKVNERHFSGADKAENDMSLDQTEDDMPLDQTEDDMPLNQTEDDMPLDRDDEDVLFGGEDDEDVFFGDEDDEDKPDSERTYNDRDCAQAEQDCRQSWELLRNNDITKISLDITPLFNPNTEDEAVQRKEQAEKLAKSESRTWTDRNGNVIASGRFQDFRNGRVFITSETGSTVTIRMVRLSNDDACFVAAWWGMPTQCRLGREFLEDRQWVPLTMTWKASGLYHKPLYFEQIQMERYGHSFGPIAQPLISAAHFFGHALTLPYQIGISPPGEGEYALGYYRPGSCAPYLFPPYPLSFRAALMQTGSVIGLVYAIP